jgi:hypothetical protein
LVGGGDLLLSLNATGTGTIGAARAVMAQRREATLWTRPDGVRCVLLRYDETRYQLKLVRAIGTIKADLFTGYSSALAASRKWREELDVALRPSCAGVATTVAE